jgi:outer membrane protein TolC
MIRPVKSALFAILATFPLCGCSSPWPHHPIHAAPNAQTPRLATHSPRTLPAIGEGNRSGSAALVGQVELDLALLVDIAFENSPEIRLQWHAAKIAELESRRAWAPFFPTVNVTVGSTWERQVNFAYESLPTAHGTTRTLPTVEMAYRIFSFGADRAAAVAAQRRLQAANFAHGRSLQTLLCRVQSAYFHFNAALAAVDAREADLRDATEMARTAEIRFQAGLETRQNHLMAQTALLRARFQLEESRFQVERGRAALAETVGIPVSAQFSVRRSHLPEGLAGEAGDDVDQLVARALRARPDLRASRFALLAAEELENRARRSFAPQLVGKLSANWLEVGGRSGKTAAATVAVSWDIFSGFERVNQLLERREDVKAARESLRAAGLRAVGEVWSAHFEYRSARQQLESARALMAAAEESFAAGETAYRNGLSGINDLLHAQSALAAARDSLTAAECRFSISLANLAHATGSLDGGGS